MGDDEKMFDRREMEIVHTMLRREFTNMPALLRDTVDAARVPVIADHVIFMADTLHRHHSSEDDFVWPLLPEWIETSVNQPLSTIRSQHHALAVELEDLRESVLKWKADPQPLKRMSLVHALHRSIDGLELHLNTEEQLVVPLMEQCITAAQWDQMVQTGSERADPATIRLGIGMLMYDGAPDVVARVLSMVPADACSAFQTEAVDAYAEHAQLVYGTTTPPRSKQACFDPERV